MTNKTIHTVLTLTLIAFGSSTFSEDTTPSENATYALAIEQTDGTVEKLITIGDHNACTQLVEQAEKPHKLSCVTTAPVASQ